MRSTQKVMFYVIVINRIQLTHNRHMPHSQSVVVRYVIRKKMICYIMKPPFVLENVKCFMEFIIVYTMNYCQLYLINLHK